MRTTFSRRQPRYRLRFLTQARSLLPLLRQLEGPCPLRDPVAILSLSLCLKSACETSAGPSGIVDASRVGKQILSPISARRLETSEVSPPT